MTPDVLPPKSPSACLSGRNPKNKQSCIQYRLTLETYRELASVVFNDQPAGAVLRQIADLAVRSIPGADEASLTMVHNGRLHNAAFTGQLGIALDERQYLPGFGPCLEVARTGRAIGIDDTDHSQRYSDFAYQAHRAGIHHTLSLRMTGSQGIAGVLTIYGYTTTAFDLLTQDTAWAYADHAGPIAVNCTLHALAVHEALTLRQALASRAVIEQAKGIVMRELGCEPDDAFAFLTQASSYTGRKVRDIAQQLVRTPATLLPASKTET